MGMRPTPPAVDGGLMNGPHGVHSNMQPPMFQQQQQPVAPPKLSSSMMPRPCAQEPACGTAREFHHRGVAGTGSSAATPSANTDFIGVDDGSAGLRYMRMTTRAVAAEPTLMSKSGVPLAVILSPFADPAPGEPAVALVDLTTAGGGGPLRCERCNAYANPGFKFINGGSQFQCNLCTHVTTTPSEHYSPIAPATGCRLDADTRHEFRLGSVEYLVGSSDYCMRPPTPAAYVFAFDVSSTAVTSGLAAAAVGSVKAAIGAGMLPGSAGGARVGIITYDRTLHYYDGRGSEDGRSVTMQIVPDIAEPFLPSGGDAFLLTPTQAVAALEMVLEVHGLAAAAARAQAQAQQQQQQQQQPQQQQRSHPAESALGACLSAIKVALEPTGGKAFVVAGSLPSYGPGKLERRGGASGGGEEREMGLLREAIPQYEALGCEMADAQISLDLFLAPASTYVDAATLVRVPRACGGRLFLFSGFDPVRDSASLHRSLCSAAGSVRAFEALLRVRTSVGVETTGEYVGHFGRPQRGEDVSAPVFDAGTSLGLEMSVVSKLSDGEASRGSNGFSSWPAASLYDDVCVQAAVLYTDPAGRRRIRVHTVFSTKTTVLGDVFKHADVDATAAFLAKKAATAVLAGGSALSKAREALVEKMTQSLFVYRKHCTSAPLSGQLILPEALKVLPVMILGLTKSNAFRPTAASPQASEAVSVDERVAALAYLAWATPADIAAVAYPRMWALDQLDAAAGLPLPASANPVVSGMNGSAAAAKSVEPIAMPNTVPLGAESLRDDAVLLVENAMRLVVWVGPSADAALANAVVAQAAGGRLAIRAETAGAAALTAGIGDVGTRVAAIVGRVLATRTALSSPTVVVRQAGAPGVGPEARYVLPLLVEDRPNGGAGMSYVEFLRNVHKRVMDKLANESAQNEAATWEMLNHGY
jgi:protein transport protein SEC24